MTDATTSIIASCRCKAHVFTAKIEQSKLPLGATICHCEQCRHSTGNILVSDYEWPSKVSANDLSALTQMDFGPSMYMYFCPTCGSKLFFEMKDEPGRCFGFVGVVEDATKVIKFSHHVWLSDTQDGGSGHWLQRIGERDVPLHPKGTTDGGAGPEVLKQLATAQPSSSEEESENPAVNEDETLLARCRCGGVNFTIVRPMKAIGKPSDQGDSKLPFYHTTRDRYFASLCTCTDCRKSVGAPFSALAYVYTSSIRLEGDEAFRPDFGTLEQFTGSTGAMRSFCGQCGASAFFLHPEMPGMLAVHPGLLCSNSGARADDWLVWLTGKVSHAELANHGLFVEGLGEGVKVWGEETYGKASPFVAADGMHQGLVEDFMSRAPAPAVT